MTYRAKKVVLIDVTGEQQSAAPDVLVIRDHGELERRDVVFVRDDDVPRQGFDTPRQIESIDRNHVGLLPGFCLVTTKRFNNADEELDVLRCAVRELVRSRADEHT